MHLVVIVSFLNEEGYLPELLQSIQDQTRLPDTLLLVDDGSTDGSPSIVASFAERFPWARILERPPRTAERDRLATAAELRAFHYGVSQLSDEWDVVVKLDADLSLKPDHFATVLAEFESDPNLGVAGSYLSKHTPSGGLVREQHAADHVRGPNKFYRRECWEQIQVLPEILGWDTIDEITARMHGWSTRSLSLPEGDSVHLRPTGSHDGRLRAYHRWGRCAYGYGAGPLYVVLGGLRRMRQSPIVLAGVWFVLGYFSAMARRRPRADSKVMKYFREEQRQRSVALARRLVRRPGPA